MDIQYFHASENKQAVRNKVFDIIENDMGRFIVDSVIVEKRKTGYALQESRLFYPKMLGYLLKHVVRQLDFKEVSEIIVITDRLPVSKNYKNFAKSVKMTLKEMLPEDVSYKILHHDSKSASGLQIADYFNWAIFRKWERDDMRSFNIVKKAIRSQFDIFKTGVRYYY